MSQVWNRRTVIFRGGFAPFSQNPSAIEDPNTWQNP